MMKHTLVILFMAVAGSVSLATAQSSQVHSSSTKTSPKASSMPVSRSLKTASAPLTPKSAMPQHSRSSVAVPSAPKSGQNAELSRLERQNVKAGSPKSTTPPAKVAPVKGEAQSSNKVNFNYKKPAGGLSSANPGANSASSQTPRVTKKN